MSDDSIKKILDKGTSQKGAGSAYLNPKEDPKYKERWAGPNIQKYKDMVYDRISALLLQQWSSIEPYIEGNTFESLQKTYKECGS